MRRRRTRRAAGAAVSGSAPQTRISGPSALIALPSPGNEPAAADAGDDGRGVGRVLEDLESHRSVTGDEVVVVKGVHEDALAPGNDRSSIARHATANGTGTRRAPSAFMRSILDAGAVSITTTVHGTPARPRRVRDALAGVAGADGPDAAPALGLGQHSDRVGSAAQLVGVDRLQVLELETNVGKNRARARAGRAACARSCRRSARAPPRSPPARSDGRPREPWA